jgi:uncharacterized protein (TIGR02217 family)
MELRAALMTYPRWRIGLSFEFLRASAGYAELQALAGFFNQRRGAWDSFLWLDPGDSVATAANFGTGDGATKVFTLSRSFGGFLEPVQDFVGAPSIYVAGVLKASPAEYTVSTGKVTFVTAPAVGAALTWSGQFYKRVRFERDETEFEEFSKDLHSARKVELITVKQ